MKEAIEKSRKN